MTLKKSDKIRSIIEEISLDTVLLDYENPSSIEQVLVKIESLKSLNLYPKVQEPLTRCKELVNGLLEVKYDSFTWNQKLLEISNLISGVKEIVANTPRKKNRSSKKKESSYEINPGFKSNSNEDIEAPIDVESLGDISLLQDFICESKEHLLETESLLLEIEENVGNANALDGVFRVFHTIKGTASFLEITPIRILAHKAENLLAKAREGEILLKDEYMETVFSSVEGMRRELAALSIAVAKKGSYLPSPDLKNLIGQISSLVDNAINSQVQEVKSLDVLRNNMPLNQENSRGNSSSNPERATPSNTNLSLNDFIKVDTGRLDMLLNIIGELVITESIVTGDPEITRRASMRVRKNLHQLTKITRNLQEVGTTLRMLTLRSTFQKMNMVVRNLVKNSNKKIQLVSMGQETELDKSIIEHIGDPLVHLIRNCADHGIESPEERIAAGKPEEGTIYLRAFQKSGSIYIEIEDDGRGLDKHAILNKGRERGFLPTHIMPDDCDIFQTIFKPGFSTMETVTDLSGRGVGMDVVKKNVDKLRGNIEIQTDKGRGTKFTIILPLTLAIIDGMVVRIANERYIIPTLSIIESFRPKSEDLTRVLGNGTLLEFRGNRIPLLSLSDYFGINRLENSTSNSIVVVVEVMNKLVGLVVDKLEGQQQTVVKSLGDGVPKIEAVSGGAIMQDGSICLILDIPSLINTALTSNKKFGVISSKNLKEENYENGIHLQ